MKSTRNVSVWYCRPEQHPQGFTLIELIVVMLVIGVLAAIAVPAFIGQMHKAKQAEAKLYLGTLNRAQQAYLLEQHRFAENWEALGISLRSGSNYRYSIVLGDGDSDRYVLHIAESLDSQLKPYVGMAAVLREGEAATAVTTLLCEADKMAEGKAPPPVYEASGVACAAGTIELGR